MSSGRKRSRSRSRSRSVDSYYCSTCLVNDINANLACGQSSVLNILPDVKSIWSLPPQEKKMKKKKKNKKKKKETDDDDDNNNNRKFMILRANIYSYVGELILEGKEEELCDKITDMLKKYDIVGLQLAIALFQLTQDSSRDNNRKPEIGMWLQELLLLKNEEEEEEEEDSIPSESKLTSACKKLVNELMKVKKISVSLSVFINQLNIENPTICEIGVLLLNQLYGIMLKHLTLTATTTTTCLGCIPQLTKILFLPIYYTNKNLKYRFYSCKALRHNEAVFDGRRQEVLINLCDEVSLKRMVISYILDGVVKKCSPDINKMDTELVIDANNRQPCARFNNIFVKGYPENYCPSDFMYWAEIVYASYYTYRKMLILIDPRFSLKEKEIDKILTNEDGELFFYADLPFIDEEKDTTTDVELKKLETIQLWNTHPFFDNCDEVYPKPVLRLNQYELEKGYNFIAKVLKSKLAEEYVYFS